MPGTEPAGPATHVEGKLSCCVHAEPRCRLQPAVHVSSPPHLDAQCDVLWQHQRARGQRVRADGRKQKAGHTGVHHGTACSRGREKRRRRQRRRCHSKPVPSATDASPNEQNNGPFPLRRLQRIVLVLLASARLPCAHLPLGCRLSSPWGSPQSGRRPAPPSRARGPQSTAGGRRARAEARNNHRRPGHGCWYVPHRSRPRHGQLEV